MIKSIVFLGGILLENQIEMIEENSIGVVQNAADALQKGFLSGIEATTKAEVVLVNLPFVKAYPRGYKEKRFPAAQAVIFNRIRAHGMGFFNLQFVRFFGRFRASLRGLREASSAEPVTIVVYSAHLPFMAAALVHARRTPGSRVCLILPDFPEFMGTGGIAYHSVKWVESRIFYVLARRIDFFVLLTRFMAERLDLSEGRFVIIEGIHNADPSSVAFPMPSGPGRVFMYAGTLAARYGILDLLTAFGQMKNPDHRLWICGDGDARTEVESLCKRDSRVVYFGQVSRKRAVDLQSQSHILVNPRRPDEEFTKYSFPSKTLEYLASGRPIVMHRLPGMPTEYLPHIIAPESSNAIGLRIALEKVANMTDLELSAMGTAGRHFVLTEKSSAAQCKRLVEMIENRIIR